MEFCMLMKYPHVFHLIPITEWIPAGLPLNELLFYTCNITVNGERKHFQTFEMQGIATC